MKFGLAEDSISKIKTVFLNYPEITEIILFGSRAKGTHSTGSDIDLALKSKNTKLSLSILNKISNELDQLYLPYTFDLVIYDQIENQELLDHIKRVGVMF